MVSDIKLDPVYILDIQIKNFNNFQNNGGGGGWQERIKENELLQFCM